MSYVFNDTTSVNDGLIQECEDITGLGSGNISGNTGRMKTFTRRLNQAKSRFFTLAFKYGSLWNMDDRNYADSDQKLPVALTGLVSGVGDYLFDPEMLALSDGVFVKDPSGVYHELDEQSQQDPQSFLESNGSGVPTKYKLVGNSIILTPTPNYASTVDGIKIPFKRNGTQFNYTDGSVPIGIPSLFFLYLANYASYPFLTLNSLKNQNATKQAILEDEESIKIFIANRAKPKRAGLRITQESNK